MGYTAPVSWNPTAYIETFKGFFWKCKVHCTNLTDFWQSGQGRALEANMAWKDKNLRKAKFLFVLYCICKYGCSVLKAVTRKGQKAVAIQIRARWLVETSLNCCRREMTAMTDMHLSQWTQQNIVDSYLHFYVCFNTWHRLSDFKAAARHTFWPESCKISCLQQILIFLAEHVLGQKICQSCLFV